MRERKKTTQMGRKNTKNFVVLVSVSYLCQIPVTFVKWKLPLCQFSVTFVTLEPHAGVTFVLLKYFDPKKHLRFITPNYMTGSSP